MFCFPTHCEYVVHVCSFIGCGPGAAEGMQYFNAISFLSLQVRINFSEHDKLLESDTPTQATPPRLSLVVSSVQAKVKHTTWNLSVSASMDSVVIKDCFDDGGGVSVGTEPRLLLSAAAEGERNQGRFLSVEYIKVSQ